MKNGKTSVVLAIALLFAAVAYAAGQNPGSVGDCLTKEQVLERHARSWQGISLTCNEAIRQQSAKRNVQSVNAQQTRG